MKIYAKETLEGTTVLLLKGKKTVTTRIEKDFREFLLEVSAGKAIPELITFIRENEDEAAAEYAAATIADNAVRCSQ